MYTIPAIPTRYNGVNFRSRLEAKWAAFFDLLGWRWDYEPVDFPGWIPDFVIYGKRNPVYVEVKPFDLDGGNLWNNRKPEIDAVLGKMVEATQGSVELLLVGYSLFDNCGANCIGFLGEILPVDSESEDTTVAWASCSLVRHSKFGFCSALYSFENRITNEYDGSCLLSNDEWFRVADLWKEAGNKVQWNPRPC